MDTTTDRPRSILEDVLPTVETAAAPHRTAFKTHGQVHGPIARLVSPHHLGELIKPFVFLDHAVGKYTGRPLFGIHPHSGIATLTAVLRGGINYEDTTGQSGAVLAGGLEWMKAGNGVWHDGGIPEGETTRLLQLWIALPAAEENAPAESQYISASEVQEDGPVRAAMARPRALSARLKASTTSTSTSNLARSGAMCRPPATRSPGWRSTRAGCVPT